MDKQLEVTRIKKATKILFWLGFLVFFAYSFQAIIDLDGIIHPVRQEIFVGILTALSKPNFLEVETSRQVLEKMWETIQIAFLATTISAVFAIPFTFLIARPSSFWKRGFNIFLQPILSAVRAVHPIIVTIPAAVLAGIGPTAGVIALTLFSTAILIGNFSDYAQQHPSLSWPILFKIHFPALAFKLFPVNILIATILGFMGGGGIGSFLQINISLLKYRDTGVAIFACIIVIGSLDLLSRAVWRKIRSNSASFSATSGIANFH